MQKLYLQSTLISLMFFLFSLSFLNAEDKSADENSPDGLERCWGMNFMWKKDFTVGKQTIGKLNYDLSTPEDERVTGFGVDWYLGPTSSLGLVGSIGVGSDKIEDTSSTQKFNATELGAKISYNFYPYGMKNPVYFSIGPWASFISYSETQTNTQSSGTDSRYEYSASRIGVGINASAYLKPWRDLNWEFYAGYNLGAFFTPESTTTQTFNGQTTESNGPSSFHFQDCGGMVGTRFFFDSAK